MASAAQQLANAANAQRSTGPRTVEGKAKSSKNATSHGLSTGLLHVPEAEREAFQQFEAKLKESARPQGALERQTCDQLVHAAWRLRRLQTLMRDLYIEHQGDPLVTPEAAAQMRLLNRYRPGLEMIFFRAMKQLRELQTRRSARFLQLFEPEREAFSKNINPGLYAAARHTRGDRELLLEASGVAGRWVEWCVVLDGNYLPLPRLQPVDTSPPIPRAA